MGGFDIVYLGVFVGVRGGVLVYINRDCIDGGDLSCGCGVGGVGDRRRGGLVG